MIRSQRYRGISQHPRGFMGFGGGDDDDAANFLGVAGITDSAQQRAIYELVRLLKQYGLWSKMKAVYPFVGGTSTTHKWNLKDPQDTDAAYRLTFNGGWTHSDTGADPNGTNATANTFFTTANFLTQNNAHVSYYSRQDSNGTEVEVGCRDSNANVVILIEIRTGGVTYGALNSGGTYITFADADAKGMVSISRRASNDVEMYENQNSAVAGVTASTNFTSPSIRLGSFFDGSNAQFFSTKECAFASIGDGLTDEEAANLYWAVDKYQRLLSRNV